MLEKIGKALVGSSIVAGMGLVALTLGPMVWSDLTTKPVFDLDEIKKSFTEPSDPRTVGIFSGGGFCSAFKEGDNIITAAHCVNMNDTVSVIKDRKLLGTKYKPALRVEGLDFAVLVPLDTDLNKLKMLSVLVDVKKRITFPVQGEPVTAEGYPAADKKVASKGVVTREKEVRYGAWVTLSSHKAYYGMSGGPVFNKEGKLVGLTINGADWRPTGNQLDDDFSELLRDRDTGITNFREVHKVLNNLIFELVRDIGGKK